MMNQARQKNDGDREFSFSSEDFERVRSLLYKQAGISLSDVKQDMVYNRLTKRLRVHRLTSVSDYLTLLDNPLHRKEEITFFVNSLTTNLTSFFREQHHFDFLADLVPKLLTKQPCVRIWSSACSVGEEPYSIAMCLHSVVSSPSQIKIIATDIDTSVLGTAKAGIYEIERIEKLPKKTIQSHFMKGSGSQAGLVKMKPHLREMIEFRSLNLIGDWPSQPPFDIIFCRNVMIYFNKETQQKVIKKMAKNMTPHGHLFIGHSETLNKISTQFDPAGQTVYKKTR